jgi:hypothetical protein
LNHRVITSARSVPTTISILDFDKNGKAITSSNPSATALLMPLVKKGFTRIGMADFPTQLASGDEAALIKAAKGQFGTAVQRFIFGTVKIESLAKDDAGLWTCTVLAHLSVMDMTMGEKTKVLEIKHTVTAKTEALAVDGARNALAGELLVDELVYGL